MGEDLAVSPTQLKKNILGPLIRAGKIKAVPIKPTKDAAETTETTDTTDTIDTTETTNTAATPAKPTGKATKLLTGTKRFGYIATRNTKINYLTDMALQYKAPAVAKHLLRLEESDSKLLETSFSNALKELNDPRFSSTLFPEKSKRPKPAITKTKARTPWFKLHRVGYVSKYNSNKLLQKISTSALKQLKKGKLPVDQLIGTYETQYINSIKEKMGEENAQAHLFLARHNVSLPREHATLFAQNAQFTVGSKPYLDFLAYSKLLASNNNKSANTKKALKLTPAELQERAKQLKEAAMAEVAMTTISRQLALQSKDPTVGYIKANDPRFKVSDSQTQFYSSGKRAPQNSFVAENIQAILDAKQRKLEETLSRTKARLEREEQRRQEEADEVAEALARSEKGPEAELEYYSKLERASRERLSFFNNLEEQDRSNVLTQEETDEFKKSMEFFQKEMDTHYPLTVKSKDNNEAAEEESSSNDNDNDNGIDNDNNTDNDASKKEDKAILEPSFKAEAVLPLLTRRLQNNL